MRGTTARAIPRFATWELRAQEGGSGEIGGTGDTGETGDFGGIGGIGITGAIGMIGLEATGATGGTVLPHIVGKARRITAPHRARSLCRGIVPSILGSSAMMVSGVGAIMTDAMMAQCSTVAMAM